jgi:hypothetical protein
MKPDGYGGNNPALGIVPDRVAVGKLYQQDEERTVSMSEDRIVHPSPFRNWHADQDGRTIWICDKDSEQRIKVESPAEWGRHWTWNFTEDGVRIYLKRTAQ